MAYNTQNRTQDNRGLSIVVMLSMIGLLLASSVILIGGYATGWGGRLKVSQAAVPVAATTGTTKATLNLSIVTGAMMGAGALGPAYVPSSFTVPANSAMS